MEALVSIEEVKGPILSLHAIKRSQGMNIMRVATYIGSTRVIILVDSGSTHKFISTTIMTQLALPINRQNKLKVMIADGGQLNCGGTCRGVTWNMGAHSFTTDFIIPRVDL